MNTQCIVAVWLEPKLQGKQLIKMEVAKPADAESALTSLRQPAGKKHEEANETIETLEAAAKVRLQHMQRP